MAGERFRFTSAEFYLVTWKYVNAKDRHLSEGPRHTSWKYRVFRNLESARNFAIMESRKAFNTEFRIDMFKREEVDNFDEIQKGQDK